MNLNQGKNLTQREGHLNGHLSSGKWLQRFHSHSTAKFSTSAKPAAQYGFGFLGAEGCLLWGLGVFACFVVF